MENQKLNKPLPVIVVISDMEVLDMKKVIICSKTVKKPLKAYESINTTLTVKSVVHSHQEIQEIVDKIVDSIVDNSFNIDFQELKGITEFKCNIWLICSRGMNDNVNLSSTEEYENIDENENVLNYILSSFKDIKRHLRMRYKQEKAGGNDGQ